MLDDVQAWFPYLRESNPNAVMMGDDYPGWPGVQGERARSSGRWGSSSPHARGERQMRVPCAGTWPPPLNVRAYLHLIPPPPPPPSSLAPAGAVNRLVSERCLPGTQVHLEGQKWWLYRRECPGLAAPAAAAPKPEGA